MYLLPNRSISYQIVLFSYLLPNEFIAGPMSNIGEGEPNDAKKLDEGK
jgi:hypothetical protein